MALTWPRPSVPAEQGQGEDWDAVIGRARAQTATPPGRPRLPAPPPWQALPGANSLPPRSPREAPQKAAKPMAPPPPRDEWAEMPDTPPPLTAREAAPPASTRPKASWAGDPDQLKAKLDALLASGRRNAPAPRPR